MRERFGRAGQFVIALAAAMVLGVFPVSAQGAGLDPGYGDSGSSPALGFSASDIVARPGGGAVVAGSSDGTEILLAALTAGGQLDPSFGSGGLASLDLLDNPINVRSVSLDSGGRILIAGRSCALSSICSALIARFLPDGSPDSSFDLDGVLITDLVPSSFNSLADVEEDPAGRLVVTGTAGADRSFAVARYLDDGKPDRAFGNAGVALFQLHAAGSLAPVESGSEVLFGPGGQLLVAGAADVFGLEQIPCASGPSPVVIALDDAGALDRSYGNGGVAAFRGYGFAEQAVIAPDGSAVVLTDSFVTRFTPAGLSDPGFGSAGSTALGGSGSGLALDGEGRPIVSNNYFRQLPGFPSCAQSIYERFPLAGRLGADGGLDPSFGYGGSVSFPSPDPVLALAIDTDGGILVAGGFVVSRLLPDLPQPLPDTYFEDFSSRPTTIDFGAGSSGDVFTPDPGSPRNPYAPFECSLDGGPFEPCRGENPRLTGVPPGSHRLEVRAQSAAGPDPTPAVATFRVSVNNAAACPQTALNVARASSDEGFAYIIAGSFGTPVDNSSNFDQSTLRLFENSLELGPAHSFHADIRTFGQGGFSHWFATGDHPGEALRFAASDNTDPRTNGRSYTYCVPDTTPPTVSIATPAEGATVSGTAVELAATAADEVGVAGVQFKLDGADLGVEDTSAPYSVTWDSTTAAIGAHTLAALAWDAAGNTTPSAGVSVSVSNAGSCTQTALNVAAARSDEGFAYIIAGSFGTPADNSSNFVQSALRLFENSLELGPAHSFHADIRNLGQERFSHWSSTTGAGETIRFSSSDHTDPRNNGRSYTYCVPAA